MSNIGQESLDIFAGYLADLCSRSPLAQNRRLYWTIIANPKAGGFTMHSRWKPHHEQLESCKSRAAANPINPNASASRIAVETGDKYGLIMTKERGHAEVITRTIIEQVLAEKDKHSGGLKPLHLIIAAGGDGTSLEILNALYNAPAHIRDSFVVLRLPMGTGNDGADSFVLEEALNLIIEPAHLSFQRAVRLTTSTPGKGPYLAFNILSVGLDAFVTHMTNRMKGTLPGDFYKLWVDIAALFYDLVYKVGPMEICALDEKGNEVTRMREKMLLVAMGESGHRYYGSHKAILPDDRNVCAVKQMPVFRKIALKNLFTTGGHVNRSECTLFNASRVEISGLYPILAQMDGEAVLLKGEDYPIAIELTEPVIPILKIKN